MKDLTEEKLQDYVDELIFEEDYSNNARKISELFKDNLVNPMEEAIFWIEYVIRHNGAYHLKYQGKYLSIIQYYSYDIYGMVILLTFAVFFIYNNINISSMIQHLGLSKKKSKRKRE
jgi:glucuronosyltransferase